MSEKCPVCKTITDNGSKVKCYHCGRGEKSIIDWQEETSDLIYKLAELRKREWKLRSAKNKKDLDHFHTEAEKTLQLIEQIIRDMNEVFISNPPLYARYG